MIPPAIVRALTNPPLDASDFTPTKWDTGEDKARFGNALLKFIANDCPRTTFKKPFYRRLSNTFGHIAHYNLEGFFETFFEDTSQKIEFLQQTLQWPCYGNPDYTYCDIERIIQSRIRRSGLLSIKQAQLAAETRQKELAVLNRLKAKYEPVRATSTAAPPTAPAEPLMRADLFDLCSQ